ncbi:MAG: PepSY-like domain-containing protein [Rikenellaceae bacterium]
MKNKILVAMLLMFSTYVVAQEPAKEKENKKIDVPALVKQAFQKDYPNIKKVDWSMENGDFEAEFVINGAEASVNYNKAGLKKQFEIEIKTDQLPASVLSYVKSNYVGYKLSEAAKITNDKNVVTFEAEVSKGGKSLDLQFDTAGKFLKKD